MRIQHRLKHNKKGEFPRHFLFVDTETYQKRNGSKIIHKFKLGYCAYWRNDLRTEKNQVKYYPLEKISDFYKVLESIIHSRMRLIIVAHNINFDMPVLKVFKSLSKLNFNCIKAISKGQCNIFIFRRKDVTITFLDNMNYFKTSLKKIGENIGINKTEVDFSLATREELFEYCKNDVKILVELWKKWRLFLTTYDMGNFGYTIASQAFNSYRHRFMHSEIFIHNNERATKLERMSYRGGRTECFFIGRPNYLPYYYLDINSMYPYVMLHNVFSRNFKTISYDPDIDLIKDKLTDYNIIATCIIKTDMPCYGVKHKGRLIFPIGTIKATLTKPELIYAFNHNHIISISEASIYECDYIFRDYVSTLYKLRQDFKRDNNSTFELCVKYLLNSLYGKFGQKVCEFKHQGDTQKGVYESGILYDVDNDTTNFYRIIDGRLEIRQREKECSHSFCAIASEVTAYSRMHLWSLLQKAGLKNVLYTDTDSVIVNLEGYNNLSDEIDSVELGKLKLEYTIDDIEICNLKHYTINGNTKIKGIKSNAKQIDSHTFTQYQSINFTGLLQRHTIDKCIWKKVKKTLKGSYLKGNIERGGYVTPFNMTLSDFTY